MTNLSPLARLSFACCAIFAFYQSLQVLFEGQCRIGSVYRQRFGYALGNCEQDFLLWLSQTLFAILGWSLAGLGLWIASLLAIAFIKWLFAGFTPAAKE